MSDCFQEEKQMPMIVFGPVRRVLASTRMAAICIITASTPVLSQTDADDCTPATFNMYVQQISTFRQVESFINVLVHLQFQTILHVDTGVKISNDDGTFYGPFAFLRNVTGRTQSEIKASVIAGKRLKLDDEAMARIIEMSENADEIAAAGFEMDPVLEAGEIIGATRMLIERSLPAHKDATASSHTVITEIKNRSSKKTLKCR